MREATKMRATALIIADILGEATPDEFIELRLLMSIYPKVNQLYGRIGKVINPALDKVVEVRITADQIIKKSKGVERLRKLNRKAG